MKGSRWVLAVAILSIISLAHANDATDRAAIEKAAQAWIEAFNHHDTSTLTALTTQDAALMDPALPEPVGAGKAVRKSPSQTQLSTETTEISVSGDTAWRTGVLSHKLNGDVVRRGSVLEIWKRVGGQWKLHRQMSSGLLVPPKLITRPDPSNPILDAPR